MEGMSTRIYFYIANTSIISFEKIAKIAPIATIKLEFLTKLVQSRILQYSHLTSLA